MISIANCFQVKLKKEFYCIGLFKQEDFDFIYSDESGFGSASTIISNKLEDGQGPLIKWIHKIKMRRHSIFFEVKLIFLIV
jgi:hypothetical protein